MGIFQSVEQAQLVPQSTIKPSLSVTRFALFNADGSPFADAGGGSPAAHVAQVTTVNATDLASAEALANANKAAINALITSLQAAGYLAAS